MTIVVDKRSKDKMIRFKIKNILLVASIVALSTACVNASDNANGGKAFTITAKSNIEANSLVILSKITDTQLEIKDSTYVSEKGAFAFSGETGDESTLYFITFGTLQPPGIPVVIESGAKLTLDIEKGVTYEVSMSGGKYNESMLKLYRIYTGYEKTMTAFNNEIAGLDPSTVTDEIRAATNVRHTELINGRSVDIQNFITNEPASPATYFAVRYLFNEPEAKLVMLGSEVMSKGLPNSSYTKNLAALAGQLGPLVEGALAPELNLATPDGGTLALSSLKGKVVLIDFWASWCGPCRRENPHVKQIYEKYKDKGFEIYGVSLDNDEGQWKAAIAKDGLGWKHVSDLGGWQSGAAKVYQVRSIPQTFLLDKDGRIVKAGFRSDELDILLDSLLN
jgi:thiol-disulfide isomerase/thioredoxin